MIFKPASRYPADPRAVFILALSVFSGVTALALQAAPDSLHSLLPAWAVWTWGLTLVGGSATTLVGMAFQGINGIVTEQIGSVAAGVACIFYSTTAIFVLGGEALPAMGIIGAWGAACFARWVQLQVLINSAAKRQRKQEVLDRLYADLEARTARERIRRTRRGLR